MKNAQNGFNLKKDLILHLVQPESFHSECWRCLVIVALCSVTRMSFWKGSWSSYLTPWCHFTILCPALSSGITAVICMWTFATLLKAAAKNLQENNLLLCPSRQLRYGSAPSFKSVERDCLHSRWQCGPAEVWGKKYREQQTHSEFAKLWQSRVMGQSPG